MILVIFAIAASVNSVIVTTSTCIIVIRLLAPKEAPKQGEGVEVCGVVELKGKAEDGEYNPSKDRKAGFKSK